MEIQKTEPKTPWYILKELGTKRDSDQDIPWQLSKELETESVKDQK
jgi:hypothetical protein